MLLAFNLMNFLNSLPDAISQGVLWGIMALGVYITFRVLDIADLTVDGSFSLGSCVCATLIVAGVNPILAILISIITGALAGFVTGLLHTVFEIPAILAGILTQIALYSINMRIMGRSNTPLLNVDRIYDYFGFLGLNSAMTSLVVGVLVAIIIIIVLYWFFGTEIGCAIRATGSNERMVRSLGANTNRTKIFGLMLSNALVALSGAMVAQSQGFGDVGSGTGAIVIGLASIVIGEVIFGKRFSFAYRLMSIVIGSMIYRIVIALVLQLGFNSSDLKLFSAIIVALALAIPTLLGKYKQKRAYISAEQFHADFLNKNKEEA